MTDQKLKIKKVVSVFGTMLLVLCTVLCFAVVLKSTVSNEPPEIFGYRFFYIVTGSMEPEIPKGSLIIVKEQKSYEENDVITFQSDTDAIKGQPNTHRIKKVLTDGVKITGYVTQGDANNVPDTDPVRPDKIYGKVCSVFQPSEGITNVLTFVTNRYGLFLVLIVPLMFISVSALKEFMKAKKEVLTEKIRQELEEQNEKSKNEEKEGQP